MAFMDSGEIAKIRLIEQGSDPSNPASGYVFIYAKSNGMYLRQDDGTTLGPFGSSGISTLDDLSDVDLTTLAPNQGALMFYDSGSSNWEVINKGSDGQVLVSTSTGDNLEWQDQNDDNAKKMAIIGW